jgi:hypothetical protein
MGDTSGYDADAIRYAVLRKLASGMRHSLMGELQTLQFSAELASKMLDAGAGGPKLDDCIRQLPDQTRSAVSSCRSVIEWLRPEDKAATTVEETVRCCLKVAGDDWPLRGIEASTDFQSADARVSKPVLRELCVAALLALTDTNPGPIDIAVSSRQAGGEIVVTFAASRTQRKSPFPPLTLYRALTYDDVATLARADGVACSHATDTVTLRLPTLPSAG